MYCGPVPSSDAAAAGAAAAGPKRARRDSNTNCADQNCSIFSSVANKTALSFDIASIIA